MQTWDWHCEHISMLTFAMPKDIVIQIFPNLHYILFTFLKLVSMATVAFHWNWCPSCHHSHNDELRGSHLASSSSSRFFPFSNTYFFFLLVVVLRALSPFPFNLLPSGYIILTLTAGNWAQLALLVWEQWSLAVKYWVLICSRTQLFFFYFQKCFFSFMISLNSFRCTHVTPFLSVSLTCSVFNLLQSTQQSTLIFCPGTAGCPSDSIKN